MIDHVRLLAMRHGYVGVLVQVIVECARPTLLGSSDYEIQTVYVLSSWSEHEFSATEPKIDLNWRPLGLIPDSMRSKEANYRIVIRSDANARPLRGIQVLGGKENSVSFDHSSVL